MTAASETILDLCRGLGFALCGVADAGPSSRGAEFRAWLAAGKHGSMEYLARSAEERLDPARVLPGAQSAVMVADLYESRARAPRAGSVPLPSPLSNGSETPPAPGSGTIARYARGRDYHDAMKHRLHALCDELRERYPAGQFRAFVDTAPVPERELAARAGLGWIGKNTLLINPRLGSYVLLGGVLTTLGLRPGRAEPDHCGACTRCIDACPTHALTPYSLDASRCISYLTIERRGDIPAEFHAAIGNRVYGCDVCQEVCPHNSPRTAGAGTPIHDDYTPRAPAFDLLNILGWTPADRARELQGSSMKRATLPMWRRNAVVALGNTPAAGRSDVQSRFAGIADDETEPPIVRAAARDVLAATARAAAQPAPGSRRTP